MTKLRPVAAATVSLSLVFLGIFARPAAGQDVPKAEISGGYQLLHLGGSDGETLDKGWYADLAGNLSKVVGIVFQVSGNYKTEQETVTNGGLTVSATVHVRTYEYMGGVRFNARPNRNVTPFGQFLVGAFHIGGEGTATATANGETLFAESSSAGSLTDFVMQLGGGVNVMISKSVGVRAGADYQRIFDSEGGVNGFRFALGGVFAF